MMVNLVVECRTSLFSDDASPEGGISVAQSVCQSEVVTYKWGVWWIIRILFYRPYRVMVENHKSSNNSVPITGMEAIKNVSKRLFFG